MPVTGATRRRMDGSSALGQGTHESYPGQLHTKSTPHFVRKGMVSVKITHALCAPTVTD